MQIRRKNNILSETQKAVAFIFDYRSILVGKVNKIRIRRYELGIKI